MNDSKPLIDVKKVPNLYFFHPLSVIIMLVLDWGGFIISVPQVLSPITLVLTFIGIFVFTSVLTYYVQKEFTQDSKQLNIIKSLVAGLICAVPTGVMSTIIGSIILALSGFNSLAIDGLPGLINMFKKRDA
jgi:hypothetical protein